MNMKTKKDENTIFKDIRNIPAIMKNIKYLDWR